jgi:hypothetical protein
MLLLKNLGILRYTRVSLGMRAGSFTGQPALARSDEAESHGDDWLDRRHTHRVRTHRGWATLRAGAWHLG